MFEIDKAQAACTTSTFSIKTSLSKKASLVHPARDHLQKNHFCRVNTTSTVPPGRVGHITSDSTHTPYFCRLDANSPLLFPLTVAMSDEGDEDEQAKRLAQEVLDFEKSGSPVHDEDRRSSSPQETHPDAARRSPSPQETHPDEARRSPSLQESRHSPGPQDIPHSPHPDRTRSSEPTRQPTDVDEHDDDREEIQPQDVITQQQEVNLNPESENEQQQQQRHAAQDVDARDYGRMDLGEAEEAEQDLLKAGKQYYDFNAVDDFEKKLWASASLSSKLLRQWAHPLCCSGPRTIWILVHVHDVVDVQNESSTNPNMKNTKDFVTIRQTNVRGVQEMR